MIIKELKIDNFGRFHDRKFVFEKGLNILYGDNEAGKTTAHTFIRGMLFGIDRPRGRVSQNDLYTRYEPWENPTYYTGTMVIEVDGVDYRLERNFHKDNKSFRAINLKQGVQLTDAQIDKLLEGLDESCYYNTISISQLGSKPGDELQDILNNYAANLVSTRSIELNMSGAIESLKRKRKELKNAFKGLNKEELLCKKIEIETQIESINQLQLKLQERNVQNQKQSSLLLDEINKLKRIELDNRDKLTRAQATKDLLNDRINELEIENNDLKKKAEQQVKLLKGLLAELMEAKINNELELIELNKKATKQGMIPKLFLLLMFLEIVGVGYVHFWMNDGVYIQILSIALLVTAVLFIIIVVYRKGRRENNLIKYQYLKDLIQRKKDNSNELEKIGERISHNNKKMEKLELGIDELTEQNIDYQLEAKMSQYSGQIEQVATVIQNSQWKMEQNIEKINAYTKEQIDIEDKLHRIAELEEELEAIDLAIYNIESAANEIRKDFSQELNKKASQYMSLITKGKYNQLVIDDNLIICVNSQDKLISLNKLSKGTIEQIYLSLRLAAANILFSDKMPIILDDTFAHYDNKRMANTLESLGNYFEQIILFTCHTREKVVLDKTGVPYNLTLIEV